MTWVVGGCWYGGRSRGGCGLVHRLVTPFINSDIEALDDILGFAVRKEKIN